MATTDGYYVYILYRPDGRPCYVGKGSGDRVNYHHRTRKHCNPHLQAIIRLAGGKLPHEIVADGLSESEAFDLEVLKIAELGRADRGGPLVNLNEGGLGQPGLHHTRDSRAKRSASMSGRKNDAIHNQRISAGLLNSPNRANLATWKGRKRDPKSIEKNRVALLGKKQSAAHIQSLSDARKNSQATINHCRQMAKKGGEASKSRWSDPDFRARMVECRRRKKSPETCERISLAKRGLKLTEEAKNKRREGMRARGTMS